MKAYTITVNGTAYEVEVEEKGGAVAAAPRAAAPAPRAAAPAPKAAPAPAPAPAAKPVAAGAATVTAPMQIRPGSADSGSYENAERNHGSG